MSNKKQKQHEKDYGSHDTGWAFSAYRRFLSDLDANGEAGDDGDGVVELKPPSEEEYEQRLMRREAESQYGSHVREARDPSDIPDQDMNAEMGQGIKSHPLLADLPLGTEAPMERIDAMENNAAKMELKRKLENKLRNEYADKNTPRPF